jgi:hypothetical protein
MSVVGIDCRLYVAVGIGCLQLVVDCRMLTNDCQVLESAVVL